METKSGRVFHDLNGAGLFQISQTWRGTYIIWIVLSGGRPIDAQVLGPSHQLQSTYSGTLTDSFASDNRLMEDIRHSNVRLG